MLTPFSLFGVCRPLRLLPLFAALCLVCPSGCGASRSYIPAQKIENPQRLRHAVTVAIDGRAPVKFTGLIERPASGDRIRAVAIQGMGLTLFDMTVDKTGYSLHRAHPDFAAAPGIMDAAASAVRRLFIECSERAGQDTPLCPEVTISPDPDGESRRLILREKGFTVLVKPVREKTL